MQPFSILLKPILSEKSNSIREEAGQYSFMVRLDASKEAVGKAVTKMFDVKVASVRTLVGRTKVRRRGAHVTKPKKFKKAIVTLVKGQKISLFEDQ